ncbi:hypothetical protein NFI96_032373 [Prochilodus magdalenae]|nr:hypothetical protein NFI96_032373 [Prochilodus magdalenae]
MGVFGAPQTKDQTLVVKESDGLGKEAVAQSGCEGPDDAHDLYKYAASADKRGKRHFGKLIQDCWNTIILIGQAGQQNILQLDFGLPDNFSSSFISLNTGVPRCCVLSPILYSLFTHDCVPIYGSETIIMYADDTTVIGLIRDNNEMAYRDEVQHLSVCCHDNNLTLNTQKTKEIIMDLRRSRSQAHPPVYISEAAVEQVTSFKFLGTHISSDLTWSLNSSVLVKKVQQRLYFLRSLKKFHLSPRILVNFYRCTIESILTNGISV